MIQQRNGPPIQSIGKIVQPSTYQSDMSKLERSALIAKWFAIGFGVCMAASWLLSVMQPDGCGR